MPPSTSNYLGNYSYNFQDSQSVVPKTDDRPSSECIFYNFGELGHIRTDFLHSHVLDSTQQQLRVVVLMGNGNNGRGHPLGGK